MKALLLNGQSHHGWLASSPLVKKILEQTGLFSVDVKTRPPKGSDMSGFRPEFEAYDLIVLDDGGDPWSDSTNAAFVDYISAGGSVALFHHSCQLFPQRQEFNEIMGLAGWANDQRVLDRDFIGATAKWFGIRARVTPATASTCGRIRLSSGIQRIRSQKDCRKSGYTPPMNFTSTFVVLLKTFMCWLPPTSNPRPKHITTIPFRQRRTRARVIYRGLRQGSMFQHYPRACRGRYTSRHSRRLYGVRWLYRDIPARLRMGGERQRDTRRARRLPH